MPTPAITLDTVHHALTLQPFDVMAAQRQMAPLSRPMRRPAQRDGQPRLSAVLLLLFPHETDNQLAFVMIQRPTYPGVHSGQIGLPGGSQEGEETFMETALRETHEEVGVPPSAVQVLGTLSTIYIPPSDFEVHPFVGYTPTKPVWEPQPSEVAGVIEMPLSALLDANLKRQETRTIRDLTMDIPFYEYDGHKIWGATAIILSEFEGRLHAVLDGAD